MMKALNDLCIKISLCNGMSLVAMLHHKDRSVPSSCQITSFASFLIFPYLFFLLSSSSIVTKFVVTPAAPASLHPPLITLLATLHSIFLYWGKLLLTE